MGKSKEIQKTKKAQKDAKSKSKKGAKKKWGNVRNTEKLKNKVVYDDAALRQLKKAIPKKKVITIASVSSALGVNGSLARQGIRYLVAQGLIEQVSYHHNCPIYKPVSKDAVKTTVVSNK